MLHLWILLVGFAVSLEIVGSADVIRVNSDIGDVVEDLDGDVVDFFSPTVHVEGGDTVNVIEDRRYHLRSVQQMMGSLPTMECDPFETLHAVLRNADTEAMVGPLGNTIDLCDYGDVGLTVEALPTCKDFVKFKLLDADGNVLRKAREELAPFTLGKDVEIEGEPVDTLPVGQLSTPGKYKLEIRSGPGATSSRVVYSFEVLECEL